MRLSHTEVGMMKRTYSIKLGAMYVSWIRIRPEIHVHDVQGL
jgi:hypothetical protein